LFFSFTKNNNTMSKPYPYLKGSLICPLPTSRFVPRPGQTCPGAYPDCCRIGIEDSFPWEKRPEREAHNPPIPSININFTSTPLYSFMAWHQLLLETAKGFVTIVSVNVVKMLDRFKCFLFQHIRRAFRANNSPLVT